jgi:hypothetical protein
VTARQRDSQVPLTDQLIWRASRLLPEPDRSLRRQEWTAEVAAILDDPGTRWRARRQVRAVRFAAGHLRGARRMARAAPLRGGVGAAAHPASEVPGWLFPYCVLIAALLVAHLPPLALPVRLALGDLVMAAGMTVQVIREHRYWLAGGSEELGGGLGRRGRIYICWSLALYWLIRSFKFAPWWHAWLYGIPDVVLYVMVVGFAERRIFARSGPAGRTGERDEDRHGSGAPPASG